MKKYASSSVQSKWTKTQWLESDSWVKTFVPETMLFDKTALEQMLNRHLVVYFKPTNGTGGEQNCSDRKPRGRNLPNSI